jgi:transcriptional regulator with XRE-family HTH domain
MPAITLATTLGHLRKSAGLSFDQLSSRSLVDRRYLWDLESGKKGNPGRKILLRIGIRLRLEVEELDVLLQEAGHLPLLPENNNDGRPQA